MRQTSSNTKFQIIYCNCSIKKILSHTYFPCHSTATIAIYSKESRSKAIDLVVSNEFTTQSKAKYYKYGLYLQKIPVDYQVFYSFKNEEGYTCGK